VEIEIPKAEVEMGILRRECLMRFCTPLLCSQIKTFDVALGYLSVCSTRCQKVEDSSRDDYGQISLNKASRKNVPHHCCLPVSTVDPSPYPLLD